MVAALGAWLLFIRTPDDSSSTSASQSSNGARPLTPTYPAIEPTTATVEVSTTSVAPPESSSTGATTATTAAAPTDAPTSATISDPVGDRTFSADSPPPWADLAGATLSRSSAGYELRVHLGGGQAPTNTDANHTMNVASFYDVDGDGTVDFEVWANLADTGWATSYFDDNTGRSAFKNDSGVAVRVEGDSLVLDFPLDHLGDATTFRWSLASEWGSYAVLGTDLAARDDAPDDDQPAAFPA